MKKTFSIAAFCILFIASAVAAQTVYNKWQPHWHQGDHVVGLNHHCIVLETKKGPSAKTCGGEGDFRATIKNSCTMAKRIHACIERKDGTLDCYAGNNVGPQENLEGVFSCNGKRIRVATCEAFGSCRSNQDN